MGLNRVNGWNVMRQGVQPLLLLVPVALSLKGAGAPPLWIFLSSALSIIPLAKLMGEATEKLADAMGPTQGGLLNATLGNAPELIISFFALKAGLVEMVKCSITGSIIGNLLFGLGLTFLMMIRGDWSRNIQFDRDAVRVHCGLLILAMFGLIIPAVFDFSTTVDREISLEISVILIVVYALTILATFLPRRPRTDADDALEIVRVDDDGAEALPRWSPKRSLALLSVVSVLLALMSETMSNALAPVTTELGLSPAFVGVFVLALLGNTAEMLTAIRFARHGKIDLAMGVLLGGSAQMALMIGPTLVLMGALMSLEMNLLFTIYDLVAVIMTVMAVSNFLAAGHIRARSGIAFIALYVMLGVGFYNMPA
jgi:Ca2+:H+ antiporter